MIAPKMVEIAVKKTGAVPKFAFAFWSNSAILSI